MSSFDRRTLLHGTACVLSVGMLGGCLTGGRLRRYRVSNDPVPDDLPATVAAEAIATPTSERPLLLEISFESTASEPRTFAVEPPGSFPIGRTVAANQAPSTVGPTTRSGPARLVLADAGAGTYEEQCWLATGTDGPATGTASSSPGSAGTDRVRLTPGESVTVRRVVLNHVANVVCYPTGEYRFAVTFRSAPAGESPEDAESIRWGFDLEVSNLRPDR